MIKHINVLFKEKYEYGEKIYRAMPIKQNANESDWMVARPRAGWHRLTSQIR
jgi:hypothetical protein